MTWTLTRCPECATRPFCDHKETPMPDECCPFHTPSCGVEDFCCLDCANLPVNRG